MAVVMSMHWPEISKEHYERALKGVRWEEEFPKGALFHVAFFSPDGFRVTDVWESEARFQEFSEKRLMPVIATLGLQSEPNVTFSPAHRMFNPGVPVKTQKRAAKANAARKVKKAAKRRTPNARRTSQAVHR